MNNNNSSLSLTSSTNTLYEQLLLKKIGKEGSAPSKTRLNLTDAKIIDAYVNNNLPIWKTEICAFNPIQPDLYSKIIVVRASKDLPRTIVVGVEHDIHGVAKTSEQGLPLVRVMVLLKRKYSEGENNTGDSKAPLTGEGNNKKIKNVIDWISGEHFVQALPKERSKERELQNELKNMKLLSGKKGIAPARFMDFTYENKKKQTILSYFMYRGDDLFEALNKELLPQASLPQIISQIDNLADALISFEEVNLVYGDLKLENTLMDSGGKLFANDFDLTNDKKNYVKALQKGRTSGTVEYFPPEIINMVPWGIGIYGCSSQNSMVSEYLRTQDAVRHPYARDMWALGIVSLSLLAGNEPELRQITRSHILFMRELFAQVKDCAKIMKNDLCMREIDIFNDTGRIPQTLNNFQEGYKNFSRNEGIMKVISSLLI